MELIVTEELIQEVEADAVVAVVFSDAKPTGDLEKLDKAMGNKISSLIESGEIKGKNREFTLIHNDKTKAPRILVMGVGKKKDFEVDKIRSISGRAARILRRAEVVNIAYSGFTNLGIESSLAAQSIVEGIYLGLYHFKDHVTTRKPKKAMNKIKIIARNKEEISLMKQGVKKGEILAKSTILSRNLSNEPANFLTPTSFANEAQKIAKQLNLEIEIYSNEEMKEMGMGAIMAVAQGSDEPAKMVLMRYKGGKPGSKVLGLIGKGITFDSGGLNIKTGDYMTRMYSDCSGACSVLGAIEAIAKMKLPVNVTAIMAMAENMPSARSYRPGDIITSYSKKTIEILNTDAEGRLVLADALTLAQKEEVDYMIDVATLTGGCVTALGYLASGIMGNNEELISLVKKSGEEAGENMWQLPLYDGYFAQIYSDVADIENSGGRAASACTAGKFLEFFVDKKVPWVHIDIAGTATIERERTPYLKKPYLPKEGATGIGVRTLFNVAEHLSEKS